MQIFHIFKFNCYVQQVNSLYWLYRTFIHKKILKLSSFHILYDSHYLFIKNTFSFK